jgi:predicted Zn-dependent protease
MKRAVLACIALSIAAAPAAAIDFGSIINKAVDVTKQAAEANKDWTEDQEVALGDELAAGFLGAAPLDPDANLQRYVNRVGKWVALHSGRPDLPWSFGVIQGDTVNAFALPGGTVFISRGLVNRLSSEAELAGVLGHEIAHVVKKHQLQAIRSNANSNIIASVGQEAAGEAISRRTGNYAAQQVGGAMSGVAIDALKNGILVRPLDRSMEYDADRLGVVIAARAGYDPYGLVAALQMLAALKPDESGPSILFSTHPAPADRIAELEKSSARLDAYASQPQVAARFKQVVGSAK